MALVLYQQAPLIASSLEDINRLIRKGGQPVGRAYDKCEKSYSLLDRGVGMLACWLHKPLLLPQLNQGAPPGLSLCLSLSLSLSLLTRDWLAFEMKDPAAI